MCPCSSLTSSKSLRASLKSSSWFLWQTQPHLEEAVVEKLGLSGAGVSKADVHLLFIPKSRMDLHRTEVSGMWRFGTDLM